LSCTFANRKGSSEENEDEDDSDEESVVPTKAKAGAPTNGVKLAALKPAATESGSEEEESTSEAESDEDEDEEDEKFEAKPVAAKANGAKAPAKKAEQSSSEGSGSEEEESSEEEEDGDEEEDDDDDDDDDDEDDDDDDDDEEEEEEETKKPSESQKRKQPTETAAPPAKRSKSEATPTGTSTSIFVGNLSWNIDQDWLASIFESIGGIVSARIVTDRDSGRPKGFGYVDFESAELAQKALELKGQEVDGRAINVDLAQQRAEKSFDSPKDRAAKFGDKISEPSSTLFVGNLSFNSTQDELYDLFGQIGQVMSVRVPTDRDSGQPKGYRSPTHPQHQFSVS
jgi:nucleolin